MNTIKYIYNRAKAPFCVLGLLAVVSFGFTACNDMLDKGNENVMYGDKNHLVNAGDTVNSYTGILYQLQRIAVRTNLLGELRGDLTTVRQNATTDIKDISAFNVDDYNAYNDPRDYYAIINNCNYFLANADTALQNNKFDYIFKREADAVRCIRAWVYLQLGQVYGANIPLVTEPILTELDANLANYTKVDIKDICDYFIQDLAVLPLQKDNNDYDYPKHTTYDQTTAPPYLCAIPLDLIRGDLYLWRASLEANEASRIAYAKQAALSYYSFIYWNKGYKPYSVTQSSIRAYWQETAVKNNMFNRPSGAYSMVSSSILVGDECLSIIPMDSLSADGQFNTLRKLYAYDYDEAGGDLVEACLIPSQVCWDYSDSQAYCAKMTNGEVLYLESGTFSDDELNDHLVGDLRMSDNYYEYNTTYNAEAMKLSEISKIDTRNVVLYRNGIVYLRLAEALNMAGFPKFALAILSTGVDDNIIAHDVLSQCNNAADSAWVQQFSFPVNIFRASINYDNYDNIVEYTGDANRVYNIGLHSRGSGDTPFNANYYPAYADAPKDSTVGEYEYDGTKFNGYPQYPDTTQATFELSYPYPVKLDGETTREFNLRMAAFTDSLAAWRTEWENKYMHQCDVWYSKYGVPQVKPIQQLVVDSLIDVEQALEDCFEGHRFGDLVRAAYRNSYTQSGRYPSPEAYFSEKLRRRDPSLNVADKRTWFINWKNQIGM